MFRLAVALLGGDADADEVVQEAFVAVNHRWGSLDTPGAYLRMTVIKNIFASNRRDNFNRAFHQWLSDTHPDVYAEMDPRYISGNGPGFDTENPEHMLVAIDYVEEFVAQSNTYPLDPTDQ